MKVYYSDNSVIENAVAVIWDDLHEEQSGFYRAFWANSPNGTSCSPVIGYCSSGGSHKTIKAVVAEFKKMYPSEHIYRNGKKLF